MLVDPDGTGVDLGGGIERAVRIRGPDEAQALPFE
jgi:hypothetical protein